MTVGSACLRHSILSNELDLTAENLPFYGVCSVVQILTQEGWNEVLYTGMNGTSPWAAIYFILLLMLGNYVIFNILVAILVEAFSTVVMTAPIPLTYSLFASFAELKTTIFSQDPSSLSRNHAFCSQRKKNFFEVSKYTSVVVKCLKSSNVMRYDTV